MNDILTNCQAQKRGSAKRLLLLMVCFLVSTTATWAQSAITLNFKNKPLKEVLQEIEKQSAHSFVYSSTTINVTQPVSIECTNATLNTALDKLSSNAGLTYTIKNNQIMLAPVDKKPSTLTKTEGAAQNNESLDGKVIKGRVIDEKGETIVGANVWVKGTTTGIATDLDGNYTLKLNGNPQVLIASFIGYTPQETRLSANSSTYNFKLKPESQSLDEVVVVGYGTTKIKDLTGSVASVNAAELEKTNATNVASILQGKAAGVMISTGSAKPGEPVKMRVRGSTSLNGTNEPLYVLDGVPVEQSDIISINPSDIQSMDILKDASAAAIYGSRAANGVVIITTKRGRSSNKPQLNISHYTSFDKEIENFSILSAAEHRNVIMQSARNTLKFDPANKLAQDIIDGKELMDNDTDWYNLLSQIAITNNTELSVRGGGEKVRYFVSLGMTTQDGVIKGDDLSRYSGRLNLDWDVTNALKFGTNISLSYTQQNRSGQSLMSIKQFRPDIPVYDKDGNYYKIGGSTDNPIALTNKTDKSDDYRFTGTIFGELELITDLKLKSSLSISKSIGFGTVYNPSYLSSGGSTGNKYKGQGREASNQSHRTLWDNTLSYNHTFNDIHTVDAVVGVSFENSENRSFSATGRNYPLDDLMNNLGSAATAYAIDGSSAGRGLLSTFGRINYKLFDKYMFTFTGRYDGSSRFGKNNEYGFFPSGAFAWKINKESFLADVEEISELKFRMSAGITGTQNIGDYNNRDLYGSNEYMGIPGITPSDLGNKDLKWETTKQYDIAIDYALLDYRFTGSIAYYYKDTDDLLWYLSFPPSLAPFGGIYKNVGRVVNQGWELALNAEIFRETAVKWNISFNMAGNRNEVKSLISEGAIEWGEKGNMHGSGSEVLAEGYPVGAILGYRTKGVFQSQAQINEYNENARKVSGDASKYYYTKDTKPGHLIYEDVNGDGYITSKDRVIIGNPEPKIFGGFSTNVSWRRFSLYAMFNFSVGNERTYGNTLQNIPGQLSNLIDYNLNNRWSSENTSSMLPAMYINDPVTETNDLIVHDASYLKLSNVRLQYDLPSILKSKFYKGGQVYVSMSNLFTITKYPGIDPASVGSTTSNYGGNYGNDIYPGVRTYTVGLKLNF